MRNHHQGSHAADRVIRWAWAYDLGMGLLGRRGDRLRESLADDLRLEPGDRVLDVGCGPGRLALTLAARVGPTGSVVGIDPGAEMVARATAKAERSQLPATFQVGYAQRLPFPDSTFDAVASTLALHHVAEPDRQTAVDEMYRVLKPGGRLVVADFQRAEGGMGFLTRVLHHGPAHDALTEARRHVDTSGFVDLRVKRTNLSWLGTICAAKPRGRAG